MKLIRYILFMAIALVTLSSAMAVFDNYTLKRAFNVTNYNMSMTDYPVRMLIDTSSLISANALRSDCNDLLVARYNGTSWNEKYSYVENCSSAETYLWFKEDETLAVGDTEYYLYYNDTGLSNPTFNHKPELVFTFWDGFDGSSLNMSVWELYAPEGDYATWTVSGGTLYLNFAPTNQTYSDTYIRTQQNYSTDNFAVDMYWMTDANTNSDSFIYNCRGQTFASNSCYESYYWFATSKFVIEGSPTVTYLDGSPTPVIWTYAQGTGDSAYLSINYTTNISVSSMAHTTTKPIYLGIFTESFNTHNATFDFVRGRKYMYPEPNYTFTMSAENNSEPPAPTCSVCNETCSPCGGGCNATSLDYMFQSVTNFNTTIGDITGWNTSCIVSMVGTFMDTPDFNQDISSWDVSSVTSMENLFNNADSFDQDISTWNTASVTDMSGMFANGIFNQDISGWDTLGVTDMNAMFSYNYYFNSPLNVMDVSTVMDMQNMFTYATAFNQDISSWTTSNVYNMNNMFNGASSFNQDISSWDVSGTGTMRYMFAFSGFDQNLGSWDVSSVTDMEGMFNDSALSTSNYEGILDGWSMLTLQTGVNFGAGNVTYNYWVTDERNVLTTTYSWVISDGGVVFNYNVTQTDIGEDNVTYLLESNPDIYHYFGLYEDVDLTIYVNASTTYPDTATNTSNTFTNLTPNFTYFYVASFTDNDEFLVEEFGNFTTSPLGCVEDWVANYTACNTSDQQTLLYYDNNSCGTYDNVPVDNGTVSACNYCTASTTTTDTLCIGGFRNLTYDVTNWGSCCLMTNITADCPSYTNITNEPCVGQYSTNDITGVVIDTIVSIGAEYVEYAPLVAIVTMLVAGGVYVFGKGRRWF